mmetsp:Transcript_21165/g.36346  ORF Transcript_21165/g.36346 Transcript_21165/m.36346 type:complete len:229 (-) Transcript_21165:862-1548(-)
MCGSSLRSQGVAAEKASHSLQQQTQVLGGISWNNSLVQVAVERHLLDVVVPTELNECLTGRVGIVEDGLQDIQDLVCCPIFVVPVLDVGIFELLLRRNPVPILTELDDGFGAHATRLRCKVDTLSGAFGHISGGITDEGNAANNTAGTRVLRNGVSLDFDQLAASKTLSRTDADGILVFLNAGAINDRARSNSNVVVLRENPGVEIRGHIISNVHLSEVLVVFHLVLR